MLKAQLIEEKLRLLHHMQKVILFIGLVWLGAIGCNYRQAKTDIKSDGAGVVFNCDSAWQKLIFTSNYSPLGKEFDNDSLDFRINGDDVSDSIILIKIVSVHEDSELPMGWLMLDLNQKKLSDITQEDSTVNLRVDNTLLEAVLKNCSKTN